MFRRGRRLFSIASILMILTSIAHMLGHFQPDPQTAEARLSRSIGITIFHRH
jgi:hypothetical protein